MRVPQLVRCKHFKTFQGLQAFLAKGHSARAPTPWMSAILAKHQIRWCWCLLIMAETSQTVWNISEIWKGHVPGILGWPHLQRLQPSGAASVGRKTHPLRKQRPPYLREMALWGNFGAHNWASNINKKDCDGVGVVGFLSLSLSLSLSPTSSVLSCTF